MASRDEQIEIAEVAAHLRLAITRTARRLRQETMGREEAGVLTPTLMAALATVERCGPMTPSEVAEAEAVKRPTATRVLAKLEEMGLIERTPDPADGRSSLVAATDRGRDYITRARGRKNALLAKRMAELPTEDVVTLERASAILEQMLQFDSAVSEPGEES